MCVYTYMQFVFRKGETNIIKDVVAKYPDRYTLAGVSKNKSVDSPGWQNMQSFDYLVTGRKVRTGVCVFLVYMLYVWNGNGLNSKQQMNGCL